MIYGNYSTKPNQDHSFKGLIMEMLKEMGITEQ